MNQLIEIGILSGIGLVALIAIGMVFARLYKRATKELAFVRTGLGGQKVITDGGAIVLPIFHEVILVNMNTLKLEVMRRETGSLITKDRMRVDVVAAFFVRVKQSAEAVSTAAQTLGQKTLDPALLEKLVEDKFVDALRSTVATMTMQQLQDMRREFVQAVQNAVAEDLEKNGLELESVCLTSLDQTDKKYFNPDNAFDAEGLTRLTEETQARRKQRNDTEQDTEVQIRTKNLDASRKTLDISKEEEFATLSQQREIANAKAEQVALIAQIDAQRKREADEAVIEADRAVEQKRILAEKAVKEAEIDKQLVIQTRQIDADRATQVKSAEQRRSVEIANQETQIAIANKSREQSDADAAAHAALAEAVKAEEGVKTARDVAVAEREKEITLIVAEQGAQQLAIGLRVSASAEKDAAQDKADAIRVEADAKKAAALAEAEGKSALNEALNKLSAEQVALQIRLELLRQLPGIIEKAVKPIEKIDSIRLFQVNGMPGGFLGSSDGVANGGYAGTPSLPDQVVDSAMKYQIAQPLISAIMDDAGLGKGTLTGITQALSNMAVSSKVDNSPAPASIDPPASALGIEATAA
jgi:uncharacterized membrane protein YqiK